MKVRDIIHGVKGKELGSRGHFWRVLTSATDREAMMLDMPIGHEGGATI